MTNNRMPSPSSLLGLLFIFACLLYTILHAQWPEILMFATDQSLNGGLRLQLIPIHLSDDVMISLRSGYILNEIGIPAFNRFDLAQPSTSYLAPYIFAFIKNIFPGSLSVLIYAFLGLMCVFFTFCTIFFNASSKANSIFVIGLLTFTTTNLGYALNGWDHLIQALFLCIATVLVFKSKKYDNKSLGLIGILLSLSILSRPDSIFIAISLLIALHFSLKERWRIVRAATIFVGIVFLTLFINYFQFGTLTPTTARLKLGASPSFDYSWNYFINNCFYEFSSISLLFLFLVFYIFFKKTSSRREDIFILFGCLFTALLNFYNSDVFGGGRMYWACTCVMGTILAINYPPIISKTYLSYSFGKYPKLIFAFALFGLSLLILNQAPFLIKQKFKSSTINNSNFYSSAIAQQYLITKWINSNLSPSDGAIGYFYLGVSYHLPKFEIADFLGKADELIASSPVKWGPPGHNKWDIEKTIKKWNLQAIVPTVNSDRNIPGAMEMAKDAGTKKAFWRFNADLLLSDEIHHKFRYCYIKPESNISPIDKLGFYLRNDLASRFKDNLMCK